MENAGVDNQQFSIGDATNFTFDKHQINGDQIRMIYLTSDGYIDQMGGERNKKIGSK